MSNLLKKTFLSFSLLHLWFLLLALNVSRCQLITNNTNKNLTFMLVTSWGGFGYNSSGTLPAAEIALRNINSRPDLLPGYNLVYDKIRDSKCNRQSSLDTFFDGVLSGPVKIGVIGCGCSVATEPVAEIIHQWNIPLISYGTTSTSLSNTTIYKNYFRANPPSTTLAPALLALMKQFSWKRIGLLTQDENRFRRAEDSVQKALFPSKIDVRSRTYRTEEDPREVPDLFIDSDDFRVFVLNSYPNARIICEIFKQQRLHPKYTWITYGWYAQASWTNGDIVNCTEVQLKMVLKNGISVEVFPIPEDTNASTLAGLTPGEFQQQYQSMAVEQGYEILDTTAAQLHDDVWGFALALNATMTMVNENSITGTGCENLTGNLVPLEEFTYNNTKMGCLIIWNLRQTNFSGVSGIVHFNENLINHTATLLRYVLNGNTLTRQRFATVDKANNFTFEYDNDFSNDQVFPDGIPSDGKPETVLNNILLPIAVVVDILAFVGILFAILCLFFNIIFQERKIVKLTSPNLNYFIIFGTILMYISIYFYLIPISIWSVAQAGCLVREWLFTIGYTLAYGALLAKLWRVYKIFHNPAPNKRIFKDWHLMVFTLVVAGIALLLLLLGTAIPQLRGMITEARDLEFPDGLSNQGVRIEYNVLVCYKDAGAALYWRIFVFAYLTVLQILGIMLAFQTRRVKIKSLKDSTFVAANVYISSIVIVVFILVTFVLRSYLNVYSAIFAVGIFILTTTFLILTFVPKMIILYRDPSGEDLKNTITCANQRNNSDQLKRSSLMKVKSDSSELEEKVAFLEKELSEHVNTIDKMKREMERRDSMCNESAEV